MAKRPASKKKKKKTWRIRRPKIKRWQAISVLLVLILFSTAILLYLQKDKKPPTAVVTKKEEPLLPPVEPKKEAPTKVTPAEKPSPSGERTKVRGKGLSAKVAIVIDDLGNNKEMFDRLLKMNLPFSFSVLPNQDFSLYISREVRKKKI